MVEVSNATVILNNNGITIVDRLGGKHVYCLNKVYKAVTQLYMSYVNSCDTWTQGDLVPEFELVDMGEDTLSILQTNAKETYMVDDDVEEYFGELLEYVLYLVERDPKNVSKYPQDGEKVYIISSLINVSKEELEIYLPLQGRGAKCKAQCAGKKEI